MDPIVTALGIIHNTQEFRAFIDKINRNPRLLLILLPEDANMYHVYIETRRDYQRFIRQDILVESEEETMETIMERRRSMSRRSG
ncbi:hypothetical protein CAEBREN_24204 [Caenorhabditis brenneri]|uniref:Uncharacterized protein n=1 Tax=Caenorhabditis brenneri TaxID=135651 RepID=G0MIS9_CAEBE|nr:hypothetical protein CAEBREN_24204 [Caenorhabditis brenneri]